MINIPKSCDSCIHTQVCSKKDIFQGAINNFKAWSGGSSSKDVIVEVRCVYYGNVPTSVTTINRASSNVIREAFDAPNS